MEMDAYKVYVAKLARLGRGGLDLPKPDSELVLLEPGGYVLVRVRVDVGVDTQRNVSHFALRHRKFIDHLHLGDALDIETLNVGIKSQVNFPISLSHTGVDNLLWVEAMLERGADLVAAYAVNSETVRADLIKNSGVGVGLDGKVHGKVIVFRHMADLAEGLAKQLDVIEIKRCLRVRKLVDREIHVWMLFFGR